MVMYIYLDQGSDVGCGLVRKRLRWLHDGI